MFSCQNVNLEQQEKIFGMLLDHLYHKWSIILKEDENIITDTGELCEIFAEFFSTVTNSIGSPDHIDMRRTDFVSTVYAMYREHSNVKAILERFKDNLIKFEFKNVNSSYVEKLLSKINGENPHNMII